ncbi:MAG: tRNA uridine-5-carboxymethylaminomethyl(34) synthesis GTPase MnmE [Variovorax sp.]
MLERNADPIVAVATSPGRGAVGIVRVSGTNLDPWVAALLGRQLQPRQATYLAFRDADGASIDQGLALYFPGPHSFTGEDVLELQAHGGTVVLQLLIARCLEVAAAADASTGEVLLPHLRLAEAGEFTARAFRNGKLDLAQAEAVADLIDASTQAAARGASRSLAGDFSREVEALAGGLVTLRMLVEATLDFPEEEIDFLERDNARGQLVGLRQRLVQVQVRTRQGALLRDGITVVIAGQPNVGKSSLLNALAGAERAIVSRIAGTTRDIITEELQIEGVPLHLIDTAGLRDGADEVERIGIERAWQRIADADVVLLLHDLTRQDDAAYAAADAEVAARVTQQLPARVPVLHLWNKCDLRPLPLARGETTGMVNGKAAAAAPSAGHTEPRQILPGLALSALTGAGIDTLRRRLLELAGWQQVPEGVYLARARHVQALARVEQHLALAEAQLALPAQPLELLAEELRLAQMALGELTGEFAAEDLLGVIFSRFCIGK